MPKAQKLVPVSTVQVVPQDDVQTSTASVGRVHAASEILKHESHSPTAAEHEDTLRVAFQAMDGDGSGQIDIVELGELLKQQGHELSTNELKAIMAHIDSDGDTDSLSFEEFKKVMSEVEDGTDLGAVAEHFANEMKSVMKLAMASKPIWEVLEEKKSSGVTLSQWETFQLKAGMILDGTEAQAVVLVLIVIDVMCVVCELLIQATACHDCSAMCVGEDFVPPTHRQLSSVSDFGGFVESSHSSSMDLLQLHRRLGGAGPTLYHKTDIQCTNGSLSGVYTNMTHTITQECIPNGPQTDWNNSLHYVSVGILFVFALQLVLLMFVYQLEFFKSPAYICDSIIVGAALVLENISSAKQGGLFVVLLSWRVLRIVHGVISSYEINNTMKEREVDQEAAELSKKHEQETEALSQVIRPKFESMLKLKAKVQHSIDNCETAKSAEETAREYVSLCNMVEKLERHVRRMQATIHKDVEEHSSKKTFDKNAFN
jgi:hypothetical protein